MGFVAAHFLFQVSKTNLAVCQRHRTAIITMPYSTQGQEDVVLTLFFVVEAFGFFAIESKATTAGTPKAL